MWKFMTPLRHRTAPQPVHTEDAWELLNLVIGWIRHAETKSAVIMAGSGAAGGLLYGVLTRSDLTWPVRLAAIDRLLDVDIQRFDLCQHGIASAIAEK
jgi:hypothetical protein